jgi:hypothetical protein
VPSAVAPDDTEYLPAAQFVHKSVFERVPLYFPAAHALHIAPSYPGLHTHPVRGAGLELVDSEGQFLHVEEPLNSEYFPVAHSAHAVVPPGPEYPALHAVHVSPFEPEKPALQTQAPDPVLPAGEFELSGQLVHPEFPPLEYLPALHWLHVPPFGPEKPAWQTQDSNPVLPAGEMDPAGQVSQT